MHVNCDESRLHEAAMHLPGCFRDISISCMGKRETVIVLLEFELAGDHV